MKVPKMTGKQMLFVLIVCVCGIFLRAWAIKILWNWFVVMTFNVISLSFVQSLALSFFYGFVSYHYKPETNPIQEKNIPELIGVYILGPLVVVLVGRIIYAFM